MLNTVQVLFHQRGHREHRVFCQAQLTSPRAAPISSSGSAGRQGRLAEQGAMKIIRCASCDGFGWFENEFTGETDDCDWCAGVGYVYRDAAGRDQRIPRSDFSRLSDELEQLEIERLREMGYSGEAKKPWQQGIRKDTNLGRDPYSGEKG